MSMVLSCWAVSKLTTIADSFVEHRILEDVRRIVRNEVCSENDDDNNNASIKVLD